MKTLILTLGIVLALFIGSTMFSSCGSGSQKKTETSEEHMMDDHEHEAMSAIYTCSMHPEVKGKKGDKCPKCGMELVLADADSHKEEHEQQH